MPVTFRFTSKPPESAIRREGDQEYWSGLTECMALLSIFVGADSSDPDFWERIEIFETLCGPIAASGKPMPRDAIAEFIQAGFRTNTSRESWHQFAKRVMARKRDEIRRDIAKFRESQKGGENV